MHQQIQFHFTTFAYACFVRVYRRIIRGTCAPSTPQKSPEYNPHTAMGIPASVEKSQRHLCVFTPSRIKRMFFDGFCEPREGKMFPDWSRPGLGLELKQKDAEKFRV
jgi:hypothetical protein